MSRTAPLSLSLLFLLKVALFLEALLSRCASDVLAGRGEEESSPLKLLSDASFYEMEAVAQSGELLKAASLVSRTHIITCFPATKLRFIWPPLV